MEELDRIDLTKVESVSRMPVTIILENIRSGLNIGSVFRTADALTVEKIILAGISVSPPHREIMKTALDATLSVPWEYKDDISEIISGLKAKNYTIAAVEQVHGSISLENFEAKNHLPLAIILGNEVNGVSDRALALSDIAIELPQHGIKHSLNISVCAGIVIWHCYQSLVLK